MNDSIQKSKPQKIKLPYKRILTYKLIKLNLRLNNKGMGQWLKLIVPDPILPDTNIMQNSDHTILVEKTLYYPIHLSVHYI